MRKADGWPNEMEPSHFLIWLRWAWSHVLCLGSSRSRWSWHRLAKRSRPRYCSSVSIRNAFLVVHGWSGAKVRHVIIWADGTVTDVRGRWKGAVELSVARRDATSASEVAALAYTDLMAAPVFG